MYRAAQTGFSRAPRCVLILVYAPIFLPASEATEHVLEAQNKPFSECMYNTISRLNFPINVPIRGGK